MKKLNYTGYENWIILEDNKGDTWNEGYLCKCLSCNEQFTTIENTKNIMTVTNPINKRKVSVPKCPNGCNPSWWR